MKTRDLEPPNFLNHNRFDLLFTTYELCHSPAATTIAAAIPRECVKLTDQDV